MSRIRPLMSYNGWRPQPIDRRDYQFRAALTMADLPEKVSLRDRMTPYEDQLSTNSCVGHAWVSAIEYLDNLDRVYVDYSRSFMYYAARQIDGLENEDAGAYIRSGAKALNRYGCCEEIHWPFLPGNINQKPSVAAYDAAIQRRSLEYRAVAQTRLDILSALAQGYPVVMGFVVYSNMETYSAASTGYVPLPTQSDQVRGGHAVVLDGYDLALDRVWWLTSWGPWGDQGHGSFDMKYLLDPMLASDFWVLQKVDGITGKVVPFINPDVTPPPAPTPVIVPPEKEDKKVNVLLIAAGILGALTALAYGIFG